MLNYTTICIDYHHRKRQQSDDHDMYARIMMKNHHKIKVDEDDNCLPAPYLYITYHGSKPSSSSSSSINNILKYSRDGCYLGSVLIDDKLHDDVDEIDRELQWAVDYNEPNYSESMNLHELRSMQLLNDGTMLVNNAYKDDSRVVRFSQCNEQGQRQYIGDFVTNNSTNGLQHPYGIAYDGTYSHVFVSNQDTNCVLRFNLTNGMPLELSTKLSSHCYVNKHRKATENSLTSGCFPGEYVGYPVDDQPGVRSIVLVAVDSKERALFVANEYMNAVLVYEGVEVGVLVGKIELDSPIGLFYHNATQVVYAGSKSDTDAEVVAIDIHSLKIIKTFTHHSLSHPTGIVVYDDILYVNGQHKGHIYMFNTTTTSYLGHLSPSDDDTLDQLMLSPC